jgi:hypothetical protein
LALVVAKMQTEAYTLKIWTFGGLAYLWLHWCELVAAKRERTLGALSLSGVRIDVTLGSRQLG